MSRPSGWRESPLSLSVPQEPKFKRNRLDFGAFTLPPMPRLLHHGQSSLRLQLPFRVSPVRHHETGRDSQRNRAVSSLPRFVPLQRIQIAKSHIIPAFPISPVTLRPQVFSPSRRLAPLATSRACFIPVPFLGFDPSRLCSPPGAVRPLGRRAPQGLTSTNKMRPPFQGLPHQTKPATGPGD